MHFTRTELEKRERETLAPFAQFSDATLGRAHGEESPDFRTEYQRDRDRITHSRAFRRLEYKTQVFLNGTGDELRTRLTHTMEVAAIARNIARALGLNEDLTESIALAHDLGHPPFGHRGEETLNELMRNHGGFEHNVQSLRVVEQLEEKYPNYPGLNLTWEVREGLMKHYRSQDHPSKRADFDARNSSLEAQVANLADEIAYYSHDLDDGLEKHLLDESRLLREVEIWSQSAERVANQHQDLAEECRRYFTIRCIIDDQVKDVIAHSWEAIQAAKVNSADDVRLHLHKLIGYSDRRRLLNLELRKYLYRNLYYHPEVHEPHKRAMRWLEGLFNHYLDHPDEMDASFQRRVEQDGVRRAVCDFLASMTDRFVMKRFEQLG
ncbi:MAG: deoxyguanosinetriphosphate triphosphohydrolase [Verrucomicrobiales bacterium]|nr:deoxyguanosinetriphosphate triphosphohydrolase [Verrucomicrobiales bacterium]|tara:strand:- start:4617 stop:5756 length:1140 start_codon:yes stop_codon:yes gene_type:complete